jgi:conserved oligomeric Golgi complex subunit 2
LTTTIRYASYLNQIKKNEEALRRLKKNARTGFSLFGAAQGAQDDQAKDDERVRAQMIMDVDRLGHEAQVFGVTLSDIPAYQALRELAAQSDET